MRKDFLLSIISFLFILTSNAQTFFGEANILTENVNGANFVYSCDIDGDGDQDVLSASNDDNKIAWYENIDGIVGFGSQQIISDSVCDISSLFASDIDGDGDNDVLASISGTYPDYCSLVIWFENADGNGIFTSQKIITDSAARAWSVYSCDIDGDGDNDVLSASEVDGKIAWYENTDGNGNFGSQQIISDSTLYAVHVSGRDIDGDGDNDVVSVANSTIAWFENVDGNGTFGSQQIIDDSSGAGFVYVCDLDGDDDYDVISASFYEGNISWYENTDGNGSFGPQQIISDSLNRAESVYCCDIDGDGDLDALSASTDKVVWFENIDGNGNFGYMQIISYGGANSVWACDADGDGDNDVLSASDANNEVALYENNNGAGSFSPKQYISPNAKSPSSVFSCDLDGDGDNDILSASAGDGKIVWYENIDGNGIFGLQRIITDTVTRAQSVYASDIDGDGDLDVISASQYYCAWYENTNGSGNFGPIRIIIDSVIGLRHAHACDIDGDGDNDVLVAIAGAGIIAWFENTDGNGVFGPQQIISDSIDEIWYINACDIDGDNDFDVISTSWFDGHLSWHENIDGNGTFNSREIIASYTLGAPLMAYPSDFDNDGDNDLVVGGISSGLKWHENTDGNGNFIEHNISTVVPYVGFAFPDDLDSDGDNDIVYTDGRYHTTMWVENTDGNGDFTTEHVIPSYGPYYSIVTIHTNDLDGDSDIDIIVGDYVGNIVAWYENSPSPQIIEQPEDEEICINSSSIVYVIADYGHNYQWQVYEDSAFVDLTENSFYSGVNTDSLQISNPILEMSGYEYRCVVSNYSDSLISGIFTLTVIEDITPPTVSCIANQTIECVEGQPTYTVSGIELDPVSIGDNCNVSIVSNNFNNSSSLSGAVFSIGTTTITWTVSDDAGYQSECSFDITLNEFESIEELIQHSISLYPNPTVGKIFLESESNNILQITITDITGRVIIEKATMKQNMSIDLSYCEDGIYFINIQTDKKVFTSKVIKE